MNASRGITCVLLAGLLGVSGSVPAQIFKCTDADGRKHYRDQPCEPDQRAAPFDAASGNLTTVDSATARREMQGAIATQDEIRARREREAAADAQREPIPEGIPLRDAPVMDTQAYDEGPLIYPYPVYRDRRPYRERHRDRDRGPRRPDETPMIDPPRKLPGGGYAPAPPTIRQVAPRQPSSAREALDTRPAERR
jgi:hypothetical protein